MCFYYSQFSFFFGQTRLIWLCLSCSCSPQDEPLIVLVPQGSGKKQYWLLNILNHFWEKLKCWCFHQNDVTRLTCTSSGLVLSLAWFLHLCIHITCVTKTWGVRWVLRKVTYLDPEARSIKTPLPSKTTNTERLHKWRCVKWEAVC